MDMMTMMMQLDSSPIFSSPETEFSGSSPTSIDTIFHNNPFSNTTSMIQPPGMRFRGGNAGNGNQRSSMEAMREMIYRMAVMQPVHIDPETVKPPKRRNVKISKDPQSVAARHRREKISQKIRILQRLVPGGTKMDTASMLDEAIHYVKFLKKQVQCLEQVSSSSSAVGNGGIGLIQTRDMIMMGNSGNNMGYSLFGRECQPSQTCGL